MNGTNYSAWDIQPLPVGPVDKKDLYRNLVGWAILAPNSHNVQPWRFKVSLADDRIDILIPEATILPASDKLARQAQISVGCALGNLLMAAQAYGFETGDDFTAIDSDHVASLRLSYPGHIPSVNQKLFDVMKSRRMNRSKYDISKPIPENLMAEIRKFGDCLGKDEGLTLHLIQDNPTRFAIAEIQYLADRAVVARNDFRLELGNYFLENDSSKDIGMPGKTFGLNDATAIRMCAELKKLGAFDPDLAHGFAAADRDGIKSAPLLGVISAKDDTIHSRILAGALFQGHCTSAEFHGFSVAVHAAIIEVAAFRMMLKIRLGLLSRMPLVLFRMGYATEQRPHSPRARVDSVLEFI